MAFQWPPLIQSSGGNSGYYIAMYTSIYGGINGYKTDYQWAPFAQYYTTTNGVSYYLHHMWDVLNYADTWGRSNILAGPYTYESASGTINGTENGTYTTANGLTDSGGALNIEYINGHIEHDFGGTQTVIAMWTGTYGNVLLNASDTDGTYVVRDPAYVISVRTPTCMRAMKVSSSTYFLLWQSTEVSGMNSLTRFRYCFFDNTAKTFTTPASMPTIEFVASVDPGLEFFDAGEGYYYVAYVVSGNLYIRGMDCSSGTPVLTGLLGGSGTATFSGVSGAFHPMTGTANNHRRYLSVGSDRVIAFMAGTRFVRMTFTQSTKATPTVVTAVRTSTGGGNQIYTEYDPLDTSQFYLIKWSGAAGTSYGFYGEYVNVLGTITSSFQGYQYVWGGSWSSYSSLVCGPYGGSAAKGEGHASVVGMTSLSNSGTQAASYFSYSCWHTPANYELSVAIGTGYSSVSVTNRTTVLQRSFSLTSTYDSVVAGIVLPAAFIDRFSWMLAQSTVYEYGVTIDSTYNSVTLDAEIITIVEALPLQQYWLNVGTTWMDDFMVYLNQDRFAVGMPRYKTWGEDGQYTTRKDVAQMHAGNMVYTRIWQHENPDFPDGTETIMQRGDLMPANGISENIQLQPRYHVPSSTDYPNTAYNAWLSWHNSPGHYANMINNWGAYNDRVYSLMGIEEGWLPYELIPDGDPDRLNLIWLYLCNNFAVLETQMFEIPLGQYWDNSGALISSLDQEWSNDSWSHVAARHEVRYSLRVANSQFEAMWGCRVSAQHTVPITYSVAAQHTALYAPALPITPKQHEASYAIKSTMPVAQQHEASFGLRVSATAEAGYALMLPVLRQHEAGYRIIDTQPLATQHETKYGLSVAAQAEAVWTVNVTVSAQNEVRYGDVTYVRTQAQADYALLQSNPIRVSMAHYYALQDYTSQIFSNNVVKVITADGQEIKIDDGVIDSAAGDVGYAFECAIPDIDTFARLQEDDPIVVDFCGELYNFVISSKSMTRSGPADITLRISADNAVVRTGQPYASETTFIQDTEADASALVGALVGIDFNYEIVDWPILGGRLQVAGATPLDVVSQIVEAAGGVVDGEPDGKMHIRYPYPHPMTDLGNATVDQYYADDYDNLSMSISTEYRDGATRFRIREGDSAFSDSLEWVPDEKQNNPQYQTGIVKAYLSPYRNTATISHLGNAAYVVPIGEEIEYHEELVEFSEGVGNTQKPIESLLSVEWYTDSMGTPAYSPFSTLLNVNPTVNKGYGLAKVRYNAKHLTAKAGGVPTTSTEDVGPASSYAYFILEDSNG